MIQALLSFLKTLVIELLAKLIIHWSGRMFRIRNPRSGHGAISSVIIAMILLLLALALAAANQAHGQAVGVVGRTLTELSARTLTELSARDGLSVAPKVSEMIIPRRVEGLPPWAAGPIGVRTLPSDATDWNPLREIVSQQPLLVSPVLKHLESAAHPSTTDAARLRAFFFTGSVDVTAGADSPVLEQTVSAAQPFETDATRTRDRFFTRYEDVSADFRSGHTFAAEFVQTVEDALSWRFHALPQRKEEVEQQVAILLFEKHNRLTRQSGPIAALSWLNSLDREASADEAEKLIAQALRDERRGPRGAPPSILEQGRRPRGAPGTYVLDSETDLEARNWEEAERIWRKKFSSGYDKAVQAIRNMKPQQQADLVYGRTIGSLDLGDRKWKDRLGLFDWEAVSSECWVRLEKAFTLAERLGLDDEVRSLVMDRYYELKQLLESNREGADRFIESRKRQARRLDSSIIATLRGTTDVGFRIGPPWSPFERVFSPCRLWSRSQACS